MQEQGCRLERSMKALQMKDLFASIINLIKLYNTLHANGIDIKSIVPFVENFCGVSIEEIRRSCSSSD